MNKKIRFSLLTLLVMLCGTVFADTYTYEFTKQQFTAAGTKALGDANWTVTTDGSYWGYDGTKGQQFGSGSKPATYLVLATSDITGTISEIKVTTSGASSIEGTLDVTVGGSAFGNQYTLTSTSTEVTFTGSASGEIKLNYAQTSSKAIYIKKIEVTYAAAAPEPSGYIVDFNTAIATSTHDFAVASNWRHIVGSYNDYGTLYYMSYSYGANDGANGEGDGALIAYRQYAGDNWDGTTVQDVLVTPVINGKVTLDIKASTLASSSNGAYVEVYAINENGTLGNQIKKISDDIVGANSGSNTEWATFELADLTEAQRIGLRCQYVYIDNFKADEATIVPEPKLTITAVTKATDASTVYFNQQQDGTLLVQMYATLQNNGDVDFVSGTTENYTLSVIQKPSYGASHGPYGAFAIPVDLAKGQTSDPILVSVSVPAADVSSLSTWGNWYVIENINGTQSSAYVYASFNKYESKFIFREADASSTSSLTTQSWGAITEQTVKNYEIANTGSAPLVIKNMAFPEGFNFAIDYENLPEGITRDTSTGEVTINGGTKLPVVVTVPATPYGSFSGNFTITYRNALAEEDTEFSCAFSVNVINPNTWTADFNNTSSTIIYPDGAIAEAGVTNDYQYVSSNNYNNWIKGYNSSSYETKNNKFITPKLHANAGDKLSFDVKAGYSYSDDYFVKVYKSTDRVNWGEPVATYVYSTIGSSFTAQSITFDEAGDYYVAFAIYGSGSGIDNIVGLEKVAVTHDLYMKEVSWPDASVKSGTALSKPSFDIIPLTNEAAENYTVKYVCGETVLAEADAKALTASAKSTTSFSFSWTPTVAETTAYEGTKIVIEFTDGTKFESETFNLTVTNEAIFHFVNSVPTSKWYEPTDRTNAISFGKTNTEDTQSFVIFNWGSKDLTVNSISLPEGFTTDAEFPMIVPAFNGENDGLAASSKTLNITFSAATAGTFSGNMVITYETDKTFQLAISGTKLDPTKFYANFGTESNQWPAGSVYQSNVSLSNTGTYSAPNYAITSSSTENNFFITPKLSAKAGDKLMFDAKLYGTGDYYKSGAVKVYAAATREALFNAETRTQLLAIDGSDDTDEVKRITTDYKTFEVTVADAGEYFFGFEISGRPYVDELYGLTAVAVENDIKIASSVVPTEAMQNVAATATVNILNFGAAEIAADAYTVKVYVDGEAVGNGTTAAIPATQLYSGNGTQVSASFRTPKVGTFPVYIEVKAGEYSVATEPVHVTFTEEAAVAEAIEVGTKSGADKSHGPVDWYNNDGSGTNWTDIVYTAKQLDDFGIKAGDKITSIAFKGSGTAKSIKAAITSWVGVKTGDITPGTVDKDAMTEVVVYDQADAAATIDFSLFNIDLSSNPIVWDGTSDIRIYTEAIRQGSNNWQTVTYDYDSNYMNSYFKSTTAVATPLGYFTLAAEPAVFSGTVKTDTGTAVEGATITLVSTDGDNVQYTGATDAEGAYSINVIQANRTYDVTMKAEGYDDQVVTIEFNGESQTKNFVVSNGNAVPLDIAAGWQQITALPENLGDYYFAIADKTENLMLSMARGKNQGGEYNGLYYKTGADAFVDKSMLFTLEANDAYVVMTNAEYNSLMIQTEWNAPHFYRTHDNGGGDKAWGRVKFTYSDDAKAWTIQNGKYFEENANFLGTWSGNVPANAEEMALNKSAEQKGLFRLYAIEKAKYNEYKANLLAADGDEPVDMTALIVNPNANFWTGSQAYGWDVVGNKNVNTATGADDFPCFFEYSDWGAASWKNSIKQTMTVPNGYYELKARMMMADGVIAYLTANDQKSENAAIAGTNPYFPNHLSVEVKVVDGKLTIGAYAEASAEHLWVNTDNFTLTFLRGLPNASESDYAALAEAIQTADAKTLGFDKDEYAPYANVEAVKALTAAKAINPAVKNAPEFVQAATAALTTATWTANADEMNAVYNGDFALCENDGAMAGWQTSSSAGIGGAYHSRAFVLTEGMNNYENLATFQTGEKHSAGYFRFDGTNSGKDCVYTYGNEAGYTMPLKPIIYEMTAQLGGWGQVDKDVTIAIVDAEGQEIATKIVHTPATGAHAGGEAIPFEFEFTPAVAGNYRLQLKNTNTSVDNAIIISNISIVKGYPAGDANLNGEVTASDAILAVSFALETETPSPKAFKAADVNASGNITVSDAVGIVNIALSEVTSEPSARGDVAENNALALNGNVLALANTTEFVAFQMDVTVAEGTQFRGVELASRAAGLIVSYNRVADNTYRVVAFSVNKNAIEAGEGAICTFDIVGNKNVQVTNIEFADAAARAYALVLGETTRINGIAAGAAGAEYYSVGGVKSDKAQKGMNVVRTADGKVKKVLVK